MRTAFEDAALPLQGWRRKNAARVGFTLTGFVGFHLAHEAVLGDVGGAEPADGMTFAPALMVGVDVHGGVGGGWRLGGHLNVLDLGALASIRLNDASNEESSSDEEPDVRVEQVFAPGVFLYAGVGPFAFGPEVSFVPSLRETRAKMGGAREPLDVLRLGVLVSACCRCFDAARGGVLCSRGRRSDGPRPVPHHPALLLMRRRSRHAGSCCVRVIGGSRALQAAEAG